MPRPRMVRMTTARRIAAEFFGSGFLLAAIVGSGIMGERLAGGNVAIALLANTLATGAMLVTLILTFGPISGGHFNPAVTITDASQVLSTNSGIGFRAECRQVCDSPFPRKTVAALNFHRCPVAAGCSASLWRASTRSYWAASGPVLSTNLLTGRRPRCRPPQDHTVDAITARSREE